MSEQAKRSAISAAARLRRDVDRFEDRWPAISASAFPSLSFTWEQLERQLANLATTPGKRAMASDLVSGTRKQAWAKPQEMVLQEILLIAAILADDGFSPSQEEASDPMS